MSQKRFDAAPQSGGVGPCPRRDERKRLRAVHLAGGAARQSGLLRRPAASNRLCASVTLWP